jgi:nitroimidazol reductase NimA-like FMN-containing flavoprotein (pyridoxamine 5'-phosphate oxidase superfamily)
MSTTEESERRFEMSDREVEELLERRGYGTLSLASDGQAYAVPMSFGYADDRLYFVFRRPDERSRKLTYIEETDRASFLVMDVASKHDWASVLVEGPVHEVPEDDWDALFEAVEGNAWFPSLFSETDPMQSFVGYELLAERRTGRKGGSYDLGSRSAP